MGSDIKPRILNDGTPFFVRDSVQIADSLICGIQEISAISLLSIISLKIAIPMPSLLSKICFDEYAKS